LTPLAWLLGLVLPACGAAGASGLPVPVLLDFARIVRPSTPNTFLAGPGGMTPAPDLVTSARAEPASALYRQAKVLFASQPRTYLAAEFPDRLQLHYVVRSAVLNFPDLVTVQIGADGADRSTLAIWSRSVYGRSDFGVNRDRTTSWVAALQQSHER
jgi:hypothetical protein